MAIYYARASGNINAAIWATTPTGTAASFYPFDPADQLVLNGFTVSVTVTVTVSDISAHSTSIGGSITGGSLYVGSGITVNANLYLYLSGTLNFAFNAVVNGNIAAATGGNTNVCILTTKVTVNGNIASGVGIGAITFLLNNSDAELIVNNGEIFCQTPGTAITHTLGTVRLNNVTLRCSSTGAAIRSAAVLVGTNVTISTLGLAVSDGTATLSGSFAPTSSTGGGITITGGAVTFNGNIATTGSYGVALSSGTASLTVNGNVSGGTTGATNSGIIVTGGNPTIVVNGNVTGGNGTANLANTGITVNSISTVTINGNVTGSAGAAGIYSSVGGAITVNGTATGGANYPGVLNASTGTVTATRAKGNAFGSGATGVTSQVGVANASTGVCTVREIEFGPLGQSPTSGVITFPNATTNKAIVYKGGGLFKTLVDANAAGLTPDASDVRSGTTYNLGSSTGTCVIPAANTVVAGTPVDNTIGTAALTPATLWDELLSNTRVAGSLGERLKNAATTTTTGQQLADSL